MFHTKKSLLTTIFALFISFDISAFNVQDPDIDPLLIIESTSTTTTENTNTNITEINLPDTFPENGCVSFPVELDGFGTVQATMRIDYDSPYFSDSEQSSYNNVPKESNTSSNEIDWKEQHNKDWHSHHQQETTNNYNSQTYTQKNNIPTTQYELFDKTLNETNHSYDLANRVSSSIAKQYLKQLKKDTADKFAREHKRFLDRKKTFPIEQAELKFIDLLISGEISELLKQIWHPDICVAQAAFTKLKELWPWKRNHTFLTASFVNGTGENGFNVRLSINIMAMAERDLISRPDYVVQHADAESFKTIQEFKEKCINFQQKGDRSALLQEELRLRHQLFQNGKNDDFTTNVCYAIAEKTYSDITTSILYNIVHAQSLEKAYKYIGYLEKHIVEQIQQQNMNPAKQTKEFMLKQYGFNILEAAYNCYNSRPDYIGTKNQTVFTHPFLSTILHNIEYKQLPEAHIELTHLVNQVMKDFEELNITDPIEQRDLLIKDFDVDIVELANRVYKERQDHQILMKSFIPIDIHNSSINILNTSHDYASVGQQFDIMAEQVFHNAKLCKLDFVENIEHHILDSIHVIKASQNDAQFVFNVTVVDHLLTDIQHKVDDIVEGKSTPYMQYLERGSELFTRAIIKFIEGLNPITQVKNIGYFIKDTALFTGYILDDMCDVALHPNFMEQKNASLKVQMCESLINTAKFTSDILFGMSYLTTEEYIQRSNVFWQAISSIPAEDIVDLVAQVAADFAFGKGFIKAFVYLKEIDVASKLEIYAAKTADKFKQAVDTHLTNNPILVTAEGVALQMSNDLKNISGTTKEVITNSRAFIESMTHGLLAEIRQEIAELRKKFACIEKCLPECAKKGFAEFKNGHIKIAYEHILGIELIWNETKNTLSGISGFHHDFMGTVEKSGLMKFVRTAEKNGCYMADIIVDGNRIPGKTFFPQHWSREDVIDKIYEAYENFIKSGATPLEKKGKYIIDGTTKEGIDIRMFITKNGHLKTAYPIITEGI